MGKRKKKAPKVLRDEQGEFRWEVFFIRGKEKRRKVRMLDGKDFDYDEYIRANADEIWLKQEGLYEILNEREVARNEITEVSEQEEDPF